MLRTLGRRARIAAYEWQYRARIGLTSFRWSGRSPVIDQIREVWNNRKMELTPIAAYQLFVTAQSTRKLTGVMAEVGVFQGLPPSSFAKPCRISRCIFLTLLKDCREQC
jgi:hypothetical protein